MYAGNVGLSQSLDLVVDAARRFGRAGTTWCSSSTVAGSARRDLIESAAGPGQPAVRRHAAPGAAARGAGRRRPARGAAQARASPARASRPSCTRSWPPAAPSWPASTPAPRSPRTIERAGAGMSVPPEDPDAFCDALDELLDDPATPGRHGGRRAGRSWRGGCRRLRWPPPTSSCSRRSAWTAGDGGGSPEHGPGRRAGPRFGTGRSQALPSTRRMGKASSAKKIKRVQQAGVSRAPGQRRNLAFPALIIGIIVVGTVLVWFARERAPGHRRASPPPRRTTGTTRSASTCAASSRATWPTTGKNTTGIDTHGDGLIRIAPGATRTPGRTPPWTSSWPRSASPSATTPSPCPTAPPTPTARTARTSRGRVRAVRVAAAGRRQHRAPHRHQGHRRRPVHRRRPDLRAGLRPACSDSAVGRSCRPTTRAPRSVARHHHHGPGDHYPSAAPTAPRPPRAEPVRAVILVGGFGTRLRPLTLGVPKQMLPGGPRHHARAGGGAPRHGTASTRSCCRSATSPTCSLREFPDGQCAGVRLRYAVEPEPLDTAGAIAFAAREAGVDERFIALNGDVLTDLDVGELWRLPPGQGRAGHHRPHPGRGPVPLRRGADRRRRPGLGLHREARPRPRPPATGSTPAPTCSSPRSSTASRPAAGCRSSVRCSPGLVEQGALFGVQSDGVLDRRRHPGGLPAGPPRPARRPARHLRGRRARLGPGGPGRRGQALGGRPRGDHRRRCPGGRLGGHGRGTDRLGRRCCTVP